MTTDDITGSLTALDEGGEVAVELAQDTGTLEHLLLLSVSTEHGTEAELALTPTEAKNLAIDLLVFGRACEDHNENLKRGEEA